MKPNEDELIAQIRASLLEHEEAYAPGAWERFEKKGKQKTGLIVWIGRLSAVAAVFLIGAGLFLVFNRTQKADVAPQVASTAKPQNNVSSLKQNILPLNKQQQDIRPAGTEHSDQSKQVVLTHKTAVVVTDEKLVSALDPAASNIKNNTANVPVVAENPTGINSKTDIIVKTDVAVTKTDAGAKTDVTDKAPVKQKTTFQEFLNNEVKQNGNDKTSLAANKKDNKWEMGVMVAPSFGNTRKLNMGYGVSMAYVLSNKVSLSSGVSYNEMAASKNAPSPPPSMPSSSAFVSDAKSLESTESKLVGIDVPLELKYNLSKKFYANVGISAFAVLSQKQSNTFLEGKVVEQAVNKADGAQELKTFMVNERVIEPVPASEVKEDRYLGFYNFSLGFRQKIAKDKAISIEPFMKVPMKDMTKENLRMMGTGVKLRFDF